MANYRLLGLLVVLVAWTLAAPGSARDTRPTQAKAANDDQKKEPKQGDKKQDKPKKDESEPDEKVGPLAWKFDKPFSQTWVTKGKQTVTVSKDGTEGKAPVEYAYTVTANVTWTPKPSSGAASPGVKKEQRFTLKIDALKITLKAAGEEEVVVDSAATGDPKLPVAALARKLHQDSLEVKFDLPSMKAEVTGMDGLLGKSTAKNQAAANLLLSKDVLTRQVECAFPALPAKKGDKTTLPGREFAVGKFGKYKTTTTYTYADVLKDKKVELKSVSDWTFTPSADAIAGVKVVKAEPAKVTLAGLMTFDPAQGRVEKATWQGNGLQQQLTLKVGKDTLIADVVFDYSFSIESGANKGPDE